MRLVCLAGLVITGIATSAAEMSFDFSQTPAGTSPDGFESLLVGEGNPGQWQVLLTEVESLMAPLSPQAPRTAVKAVLTQTDHDPTDERFPILAYTKEEFGDFELNTRLRILGGETEQMAGIAFRLQDEENFYVVRLSALGQNIRFYKVVAGMRGRLLGPSISVRTNVWYDLGIKCQGNEITLTLNDRPVIPPLQDSSFSKGTIGFWTKSDSICQFAGASIGYTPTVALSEQLIQAALEKYPRVKDLQLYAFGNDKDTITIVASKNPEDIGSPGGKAETGALQEANIYVGKGKRTVTVVMPVRDRNGDPVAAVRVLLESFPGQTENNAIVRAKPIVRLMEQRVQISPDPFR
jgi:hypothetical protein